MIAITNLPRVFNLSKNNQIIELEDINVDLTPETIQELYSVQYPELVNATITNRGIENDKIVYEFNTIAGTKG